MEMRANGQVQDQQQQKQWVCVWKAFSGLISIDNDEQKTITLWECKCG